MYQRLFALVWLILASLMQAWCIRIERACCCRELWVARAVSKLWTGAKYSQQASGEHASVEVLILRQSNQSNSKRSSTDIGDDGFEPLLSPVATLGRNSPKLIYPPRCWCSN
jgi:hypothetical protein